jgi:hypothetical protein
VHDRASITYHSGVSKVEETFATGAYSSAG